MGIIVNGEVVDPAIIERELAELTERYRQRMTPEEAKECEEQISKDARENAVERVLLLQEARRAFPDVAPDEVDRGFLKLAEQYGGPDATADMSPEEIAKLRGAIAEDIRMQKYFDQICKDVPEPTEGECRAFYDEHKSEFVTPEMVHASHIVRQAEPGESVGVLQATMLNLRERARRENFEELARQYSSCDDEGGDLGWFGRGTMVEEFDDIVFALKPGEVSQVFRTQFGFHIVKVHDKRPPRPLPFERVHNHIKRGLHDDRKNEAIGRAADRIKETAKIEETEDKAQA